MLIASARLASTIFDRWEAPRVGLQADDDTRGLLRIGLPPVEEDHGLGFALPEDCPPLAVSTNPWLWRGARFSLDIERGLAKALWGLEFPSDD